ncbi:pyrroloquinoline quinone biosynthesis peptide chaperone PqqD [Plastorhodobacter daqingensis]|uniref:Pyrroloquinoline quinone biosynthesis peptide chaperone PqqD n=1 Tax=Plastorhodobacter daqingensis TaxID=1387281 RepID=A0ABW2ULC6_9RHOB
MSARPRLAPADRVTLARHARLRFDSVRGRWVLLVPERVMVPDETCTEILQLCDGDRSIEAIAATLSEKYTADEGVIRRDVIDLLQGLADKGFLRPMAGPPA